MTRLSRSGEGGCGEPEPEPLRGVGGGRGQGQRGGPRGGGLPHRQGQLRVWRVWLRHPPHPRQEARGHSWGLVRSNVKFKCQVCKIWFTTINFLQVSSAVCFLLSPGASFIRFLSKVSDYYSLVYFDAAGQPWELMLGEVCTALSCGRFLIMTKYQSTIGILTQMKTSQNYRNQLNE